MVTMGEESRVAREREGFFVKRPPLRALSRERDSSSPVGLQ